MNDTPRATLEKLNEKQHGMRVDFYWLGDRFGHTISAVRDGEATVVWRSIQDDDQGAVFQELHEQTTDDGRKILFLSGASAGAHWSASVEFEEMKCSLIVDAAARVTDEPTERVIEYRGEFQDKPAILCGHMDGHGSSEAQESPPAIRFQSVTPDDELPTTLRYKYAFF